MGGRARVEVVSPYAVVRAGVEVMLDVPVEDPGAGLDEAVAPDVVVYDLAGLTHDATRHLLRHHVDRLRPVVGLAARPHRHLVVGALALGAITVVPEDVGRDELREIVGAVARGRRPPDTHPSRVGTALTARELQVIRMVAGGTSNAQIATALHLSPNSVKTYIRMAYRKIGVRRRSEAVLWVIGHGQADQSPARRGTGERQLTQPAT